MDKINTKHSNYTTPEQSKRLLELGVPADSADCYFEKCTGDICIIKKGTFSTFCDKNEIPCWSVGELMRIYAICFDPDFIEFDVFADGTTFLQQMMNKFEICIDAMDFSKLEK